MERTSKGKRTWENIALIGFMATGKSSVGRRLALALNWEFVDTDEEIEKVSGLSVAEMFQRHGETRFRSEENLVLRRLGQVRHHVIATGGGMVVNEKNRDLLAERALVISLYAPLDKILDRVGDRAQRPLLRAPSERIEALWRARESVYDQADMVVDTSELDVDGVVREILRELPQMLSAQARGMNGIKSHPTLEIRGKQFGGGGLPLICTPLVGESREALVGELERVLPQGPDLLEWRLDFFANIRDMDEVIRAAQTIRKRAAELPLLFTIRSEKEGGHPLPLTADERAGLYQALCQDGLMDLLDFELSEGEENFRRIREMSRRHGVKLMGSFHDFVRTPPPERIMAKFRQAEQMGADLVKAAVMPQKEEDVLTLLRVTLEGKNALTIPVVTVSMGSRGSLTRMCGWVFGSALTFAMGENRSAPGQIPIGELKTVLSVMQKALGGI